MRMKLLTIAILGIACATGITAKAEDKKIIVAFGDSTTARRGKLKIYCDILSQKLPKKGVKAKVINAGVGGNTTDAASRRFETDVLEKKPDLVIIQFGINDSVIDVSKGATDSRLPLKAYDINLRKFVKAIRKNGGKVILMTPNAMSWTPGMKKHYNKPPYDTKDPKGFNAPMLPYVEAVRKIAEDEKVELIDVYAEFDSKNGKKAGKLLLDGMHPNKKGHKIVADKLLDAIPKMLKSK